MTDTVLGQTEEGDTPPDTWAPTALGEICARVGKVNPKDDPERRFTYLDIAAIDNTTQKIVQPKTYSGADAPSRARQLVQSGDVLFSTVRTYLRNIAQVPQAYDGQIASTGFTVIRPMCGVEDRFLFHLVQTNEFLEPLNAKQRGTSYPAVRDADVFAQPVLLPPLNEQRRIVEKIEELFAKLDAGVRSLEQARALVKAYRRSVLKAAVEGELSREWREAHKNELEPASELLERILQERLEKLAGKKYKEPALPETSSLPTLPVGWIWASMGQLLIAIEAGKNFKCREKPPEDAELGLVKISAVTWGKFNEAESKTVTDLSKENQDHLIHEGDFLFTRANTLELVGACVIVHAIGKSLMLSDKVLRFRFVSDALKSWVLFYLRSYLGRQQIESLATGNQLSMRNISQASIHRISIPLPSITEMESIVEEIERRLSVVDKLETTLEANLKQAVGLRQSILKKAFSGELVAQDPDDEPVSVLLERIREERQGTKPKPRKRLKNTAGRVESGPAEQIGLFDST